MNRGFGFLLAVPIFIAAIMLVAITTYVKTEQQEFEEYCLSYAVDYATDAAAMELTEGAHLGLDYQDWGRVQVDPDSALRVFETVMLSTYDYPLTDKAFESLASNYMPLFCVAAYDGYYIYSQEKDSSGSWHLTPTQKIPYSYTVGNKFYALNLGLSNCRKLVNGKLTLEQLNAEGISTKEVLYQINSQVSDDLMYRYQRYQTENTIAHIDLGATFYIPQGLTTMTQVNAIEGPTVLALIDNWDVGTLKELSSFSIGGARIEPTRQVACYTDTSGNKWYAYADMVPGSIKLDDVVPGPVQAASKGYHYDFEIMG